MKKLLLAILVIAMLLPAAVSAEEYYYEIYNETPYVRDGQECMAYRVIVGEDSNIGELCMIYYTIREQNTYYLNTVFFYESAEDIEYIGACTIGQINQLKAKGDFEYVTTIYSTKDLEALRKRFPSND